MGGELEKTNSQKKVIDEIATSQIKGSTKKIKILETENNKKRKNEGKSIMNTTNITHNNRDKLKKKKIINEKLSIISKDKIQNEEKNALELIHEKNPAKEDFELIHNIISNHFFLQTLNDQAKNEIIISMSLYKLKEKQTLYKQGSNGNYWYIVKSGKLNIYINEKLIGSINEGQSFGEHALMNNSPRDTTIISETECKLWVLKRQVFRKVLEFIFTLNYEQNMKFLNSINIPLDSTIKSIMASNLIQEIYHEGQYIFKEGEFGNCMYIIKEGEIECIKNDKVVRILKQGDNFGQKALLE